MLQFTPLLSSGHIFHLPLIDADHRLSHGHNLHVWSLLHNTRNHQQGSTRPVKIIISLFFSSPLLNFPLYFLFVPSSSLFMSSSSLLLSFIIPSTHLYRSTLGTCICLCCGDFVCACVYVWCGCSWSPAAVCTPDSAQLLLHGWGGLEVSDHAGLPTPHHRLFSRPPDAAERLHWRLLWPSAAQWPGEVDNIQNKTCYSHSL